MCRSIHTLRGPDGPASDDEVRAAALQFVRKVSGYRVPSRANSDVFQAAVDAIAASSRELLEQLVVRPELELATPGGAERKDRAWYREKARAREPHAHGSSEPHRH
jgi:hypothetical protein